MASSAGTRRGPGGSDGAMLLPGPRSRLSRTAAPGSSNRGTMTAPSGAPDPSVLRPSVAVSMSGMKQAIKVMENGTQEVRILLKHADDFNHYYYMRRCVATSWRSAT